MFFSLTRLTRVNLLDKYNTSMNAFMCHQVSKVDRGIKCNMSLIKIIVCMIYFSRVLTLELNTELHLIREKNCKLNCRVLTIYRLLAIFYRVLRDKLNVD